MREVSLKPYTGRLFIVNSKKEYEQMHKKLFKTPDVISCNMGGHFSGGEGKDKVWTYLLYAKNTAYLAHELAHIVFHVFERCNINPACGNEEPFCYMLSQLMLDCRK